MFRSLLGPLFLDTYLADIRCILPDLPTLGTGLLDMMCILRSLLGSNYLCHSWQDMMRLIQRRRSSLR